MELQMCKNGHYFDIDKFIACPYCSMGEVVEENRTKTVAMDIQQMATLFTHRIRCVSGERRGAEIHIEPGQKILVGRDSNEANLVFRDTTISRKHCLVELNEKGDYFVTDYSKAGLKPEGGAPIAKGVPVHIKTGTVLEIGKAGTKIALE